jgi:hypothetical protein
MCIRDAIVIASLVLGGCRSEDECDRALARLARIESARHQRHMGARMSERTLDECRAHTPDPVLQCALTARTDDEAAACIDAFLHDVVGPGTGAPHPPDGKGLNPLLDDD